MDDFYHDISKNHNYYDIILKNYNLSRIRLDIDDTYCYIVAGHCNIFCYYDPITLTISHFDFYYYNKNRYVIFYLRLELFKQ